MRIARLLAVLLPLLIAFTMKGNAQQPAVGPVPGPQNPGGVTCLFTSAVCTIPGQITFSGNPITFSNIVSIGDGTSSATLQVRGIAGQVRQTVYKTGGNNRWAVGAQNNAETGSNIGSDYFLAGYTDSGGFSGTLAQASRASGPYGTGAPYWNAFGPITQSQPKATIVGGAIGNLEDLGATSDQQPLASLGANPLSVQNSSPTVTVTWANCCGSTSGANATQGPLYTGAGGDIWVDLEGTVAVGGITPTGYLKVQSNVDVNTFTVTWTSSATSTTTGGGSSMTARPSFATLGNKTRFTFTTGAGGFPLGIESIYAAIPAFYQPAGGPGPGFEHMYSESYGPNDTSGTHQYATGIWEMDPGNGSKDIGYAPVLSSALNHFTGMFVSPLSGTLPAYGGGGTGHSIASWESCSPSANFVVGTYSCYTTQPNSLVGAANDPTGIGGVALDAFGSMFTLGTNPYATGASGNLVTVSMAFASNIAGQVNGNQVNIPNTYSANGVTCASGVYNEQNVNTGAATFQIQCSGSSSGAGSFGGSNQPIAFKTLDPFAPVHIQGEWTHGIFLEPPTPTVLNANLTTFASIDDNIIVNSWVGVGIGWRDAGGLGATINTHAISTGNMDLVLGPTGTGTIKVGANAGLSCSGTPTSSFATVDGIVTHC